ncbi:hypothetical protein CCACVL1_21883 [Corchorus capsularis]|uniref:Uncharacterized protein n=1 Tax=Corchorus capsularis TaxID=210143 RepID=A0A1R3H1R2_COCAP|nr:hypothetical protein CCACVL1_21883 [Corchorus capsularis]
MDDIALEQPSNWKFGFITTYSRKTKYALLGFITIHKLDSDTFN